MISIFNSLLIGLPLVSYLYYFCCGSLDCNKGVIDGDDGDKEMMRGYISL